MALYQPENWQTPGDVLNCTTDAAVTKGTGAILKAGREVGMAETAGERILGVFGSTESAAGKPIDIIKGPVYKKVLTAGAYSDNAPLSVAIGGKFQTATAGHVVVADAQEASGGANEYRLVFLRPPGQYRISSASVVDLTDSSGFSGTHDDTLAAVAVPTTLTDSTGQSGTHDDTLAATTVPTITALNPAAPTAYTAVVNMTDPVTKAQGEAVSAALATLRSEVATYETAISALIVDVAAILALLPVMAQNQSDVAQKVIEHNTQLTIIAQNQSDTAQKVKELIVVLDAQASTL